jgi:ATP-dependent Clp protease adaptor protein ClpS
LLLLKIHFLTTEFDVHLGLSEFIFIFAFVRDVKTNMKAESSEDIDVLTEIETGCQLIVWNDEVNTFEWVIETLMTVCGHSQEQAEQCSYIIHFRGKYAVKQGSYDDLKPQCDAITERGIDATIEVLAD